MVRSRYLLGLVGLGLLVLLSACGLFQRGGGGSYTLSLNPSTLTLAQGAQGQVGVGLNRQGFTQPVELTVEGQAPLATSPAPDRIAWSFSPNPAAGDRSTLTLQVGAQVPAGSYTLTVRGRAQGQADQTATLRLAVQAGGGGGGGGVELPPPQGGQGFPQPRLEVGPPAAGAGAVSRDEAVRVQVVPEVLTLTPGEERYLAVWVEDGGGNRFAGDGSYLELEVYNPGGYEVGWAGPGRVRVKAPGAFRGEALVVNVRRRDLVEGRRYLNAVATVSMVEPKPGVVVLPEEVVGFPTTYELDAGTLLARLGVFTREELARAIRWDMGWESTERPVYPVVVRETEGLRLEPGVWVVSEGESALVQGRIREVVARRGGYTLLAVELALPWEVYARYQEEVDLKAIVDAGVNPLDADGLEAGELRVQVQGVGPLSEGQGQKRCEREGPRVGQISGGGAPGEGFGLVVPFEVAYECEFFEVLKFTLTPSVQVGARLVKFGLTPLRVGMEFSVSAGVEAGISLEGNADNSIRLDERGRGTITWAGYISFVVLNTPAWGVALEAGLAGYDLLSRAGPEEGSGGRNLEVPEDAELFRFGVSGRAGGVIKVDSSEGQPVQVQPQFQVGYSFGSPFFSQEGGLDLAEGRFAATMGSDIAGFGVVVGAGVSIYKVLEKVKPILGWINADSSGVLGVSGTFYPVTAEMAYEHPFRGSVYEGPQNPGKLESTLRPKVTVRLRGTLTEILRAFSPDLQLSYDIPIRQLERTARSRVLPGGVQVQLAGSGVQVRGTWTGEGGARLARVEAYRKRGEVFERILREEVRGNPYTLSLPRPANCQALAPEERLVYLIGEATWPIGSLPVSLGWHHLGVVNLCESFTLEVPALRAFEGEEAQGQGVAVYEREGRDWVEVRLRSQTVDTDRPLLIFTENRQENFGVRYTCREEGSFVGSVEAYRGEELLAQAPVVVTCLDDPDNDPRNNPRNPDVARRFWGDPHLITPDGAAYDFHAQGEFWGSIAPEMPFQLRFAPMPGNPEATYTSRLAARLGEVAVEVYPLSRSDWPNADTFLPRVPLGVVVAGQDRTEELSQRGYLSLPGDAYVVVARWGEVYFNNRLVGRRPLEVHLVFPGANPRPALLVIGEALGQGSGQVRMLGVGTVRPGALAGRLTGLMGNANGDPQDDFVTRQGQRLAPPLSFGVLYGVFGRSWEVLPGERLFSDGRPEVRYPSAPPILDPERVREAEAFCGNIPDPYLRQACLLDAAVSGDAAGAARIAQGVAQAQEGAAPPNRPATVGARLGVSPTTVRLGAGGEAQVVLANPTGEAVAYRLRLVGEGPGVRVDGSLLAPGGSTPEATLEGGRSRTLRLAGVCPEGSQEGFLYLLAVEEREAAESRSVLVGVECRVGLEMRLLTPSVEVLRGGQTEVRVALRPLNLEGQARVRLSLLEGGNPAAGLSLDPAEVTVQGSGEQTFTLRLLAAPDAATGERLLSLVAELGGARQEESLRVRVQSAYTWTGAGDGRNMNDCRNWSGGRCPGPRDVAEIVNPGGSRWSINMNLPELGGLVVRGAVTLVGGPLRVSGSGSLEGDVWLQGHLRVGSQGVLVTEGLTLQGNLEVQTEGEQQGRAVLRGETRFLSGALRGPGSMRNEGLLRIGPSSASKHLCATVTNVGTVRMEGSDTSFGCSSTNLPGVLENRAQVLLGDASVGHGHSGSAIHNHGAFVKDRGTGTAYIGPTFYAHPGGYEQALSGQFNFRDYRNLR